MQLRYIPQGHSWTADMLTRAGEAKTVHVEERRCLVCGGRLQRVVDNYGGERSALHCRRCGKVWA